MKKILIGLGAVSAAAMPVIAVVSCGGSSSLKEIKKQETTQNSALGSYVIDSSVAANPIAFADIKVDAATGGQIIYGPAAYGLAMGGSFLINLAERLGFKHEDADGNANDENVAVLKAAIAEVQPKTGAGAELSQIGGYRDIDLGSMGTMTLYPGGHDNFTAAGYMTPTSWSRQGDGIFLYNGHKFQINDYTNWIDATKPGFTKIQVSVDKFNYKKTLTSAERIFPEFKRAEGQFRNEIISSVVAAVDNFKKLFRNHPDLSDGMIRPAVGDVLLNAIQYLSDNDFTEQELVAKIDEINNGSFDMHAIEMILRGVTNVPAEVAPKVSTVVKMFLGFQNINIDDTKIPGMASLTRATDLVQWFYNMPSEGSDGEARVNKGLSPQGKGNFWLAPTAQ